MFVLGVLLLPAPAAAQPGRLVFRGSGGLGSMISEDQLGWLGFESVAFGGAIHGSWVWLDWLRPELRIAGSYFPSTEGAGAVAELGAGARLSIQTPATRVRAEAAAHLNVAWTGEDILPELDLSLGASLAVSEEVGIGPELVYSHVFWTDGEGYSTDARWLSVMAFVSWHPGRERDRGPRDRSRTIERHTIVRERIVERIEPAPLPPVPAGEIDRLLEAAVPGGSRHITEIVLIPPVLFDFDSARVSAAGEVALHTAREVIAEMPDAVVIEGHADGRGSDEYNAELSLARAMFVRDWLVAHGIAGERLTVEAYGEHLHLREESDEHTRQMSRRVTFRVVRERPATPTPILPPPPPDLVLPPPPGAP